ncbi:MAG: hypothetical protein NXI31_20030 [bacterium]|nr:hypothetical protein [bacterium]
MGSGGGPSAGGGGGGARGPSGPGGGAAAGPRGGGGGIALDFTRKKTAKKRLKIDWTHPVWKPEEEENTDGRTAGTMSRFALPIEKAYEVVTDSDKRPLLIMRECEKCKGTDHALLSRTMSNEQTVLLTHWFRCVKLPPNILEKDHPLTNLFKREKGEKIPHLFFVDPDGTHKTPLSGTQSQRVLWETMFSYLDRCYDGNAKKSLKELRKILDQYDRVDGLEQEVMVRRDREIEKKGLKSPKLKKYLKQLDKLSKEREKLVKKEKALRALALRDLSEGDRSKSKSTGRKVAANK